MRKRKANILKLVLVMLLPNCATLCSAQNNIKEIVFHLYTDSLKKGTYNYINVDARLDNGDWRPMDTSQVAFASSEGKWFGNNLLVDPKFTRDSIVVKSFLKSNPIQVIDTTIYIKKNKDPQILPTMEQILKEGNKRRQY